MSLPVIIVPIVLFIDSRRRRLEGDTVFAREVRARSKSGKRFAEARYAWNDQDFNRALDAAAAGFARYLADRLGLPTGGITIGLTIRELTARSVANHSYRKQFANIGNNWKQHATDRWRLPGINRRPDPEGSGTCGQAGKSSNEFKKTR